MNEDTRSSFNFIVYMFFNQPSFLATTGGGGEEKKQFNKVFQYFPRQRRINIGTIKFAWTANKN